MKDKWNPEPSRPNRPEWLSDAALRVWDEVVPILHDQGILHYLDQGLLAVYCQSYATYQECQATMADEGYTFNTGEDGNYKMPHPAATMASKMAEIMIRISDKFGFNPMARGRLSGGKGKGEEAEPEDERMREILDS